MEVLKVRILPYVIIKRRGFYKTSSFKLKCFRKVQKYPVNIEIHRVFYFRAVNYRLTALC